ncbi:MAG TPA: peptidoglycan DD-metalloendopeptidase family protein [Candidatus Deferrimicrobium sp.]|nr:peptidoglycan DD-metalloendopeptidase family protein [Candidatus Deferrimicrobium sp.]
MSKLSRKIGLTLSLIIIFVLSTLLPALGDNLNDKLKENKQQQQQTIQKISKYQDEEEDLRQSLVDAETKMSESMTKLTDLDNQLTTANAEVSKAEKELSASQAELTKRTEALHKRIRGVYQEGEVTYLQLLFQSSSLSDFVNRLEYLRKILSNDQRLVEEISKQKNEIQTRKSGLVKQRDSVAAVKTQQEQEKSQLQQEQGVYQTQLAKKQSMLDQLTKELSISQAEEQQIQAQIDQVIKNSKPKNSAQGSRPGALSWPAPSVHSISSKFGMRYHPVLHVYKLHTGIDIPVSMGSQVVAAADGEVIWAGYMTGYGYTIIVSHGGSMQTLYAHLSSYGVRAGDDVKAGQTIALSGGAAGHPGAGYSTGPHLHFEVRINGVPEDPVNYL